MGSKKNPRELSRLKRKKRINPGVRGTSERPRLCVYRSEKHIYAQVINDMEGHTLASASTLAPEFKSIEPVKNKVEAAERVGEIVANKAKEKGVEKVVFCRNGFIYHGRVKALADAARKAGLDF